MKNKHNDSFVEECFFEAAMKLMEEKPFQKITVKEITDQAGFSRMTYYRHYSNKEDILSNHIDRSSRNILKHFQNRKSIVDDYDFLMMFFSAFRSEKSFLRNIIDSNLTYLLLDAFKMNAFRMIKDYSSYTNNPDQRFDSYKIHFIAGGLFEVLIEWAKADMRTSDEEMAKKMIGYFSL